MSGQVPDMKALYAGKTAGEDERRPISESLGLPWGRGMNSPEMPPVAAWLPWDAVVATTAPAARQLRIGQLFTTVTTVYLSC